MVVEIRLKQMRELRGLSQFELAQKSGMSPQNVQKLEQGRAKGIQLDTLDSLCAALECEIQELLVRVGIDHPAVPVDAPESLPQRQGKKKSPTELYVMKLIEFFVNDLIPDDESLCLIARLDDFGLFDPESPAQVESLSCFSDGYRSPELEMPDGNYAFFGSCTEIRKRQQKWSREDATALIRQVGLLRASEQLRSAYIHMCGVDPDNLSPDMQQLHSERLAEMEEFTLGVERSRLEFNQ